MLLRVMIPQEKAEEVRRLAPQVYVCAPPTTALAIKGEVRQLPRGHNMSESTVAIHMPDLLYQRLQRLEELTQRPLESLVLQALDANIPPLLEDMPEHIRQDLAALENAGRKPHRRRRRGRRGDR